jgi:hypothetical protein
MENRSPIVGIPLAWIGCLEGEGWLYWIDHSFRWVGYPQNLVAAPAVRTVHARNPIPVDLDLLDCPVAKKKTDWFPKPGGHFDNSFTL